MTGGANPICIAVVEGEEGVVTGGQSSRQPGGCGVAGGAGSGPSSCNVVGICGSNEVCLVAGVAIRGGAREDIVDVAFDAIDGGVRAGKRERSAVVVEGGSSPSRGGVACLAGCREARGRVRGVSGSGPVGLVAAVAGRGERGVVVVHMAGSAGNSCMRTGKRECRGGVIEGRGSPVRRGVADGAIRGEAGGDVVWIRSSREVGLMAGVAGCWRRCVVVVGVALGTRDGRMSSGKRVVGIYGVIEGDGGPVSGVVARVACGWESRRNVTWIRGASEVSLVAPVACRGQCCVVVVGVALSACNGCVCAGEREDGGVIEGRRSPVGGGVA